MGIMRTLLATGLCLLSATASAVCIKGPDFVKTTNDSWGVGIGLGNINVTSSDIQPPGTVLASAMVNFSDNPRYKGPDSVLYVCDITDVNNIYEIIATNGDDRSSGFWDMGAADGNPNVYGTWFNYVGLRLTHVNSGTVFTRNYQRIPMTRYAVSDDGKKINIRVKDFSPIRADAIRVSAITLLRGRQAVTAARQKVAAVILAALSPMAMSHFVRQAAEAWRIVILATRPITIPAGDMTTGWR